MKILVAVVVAVAISASPADAKGFLSALLRGGAKSAARAGAHAGVHSYTAPALKTYGTDTLTVEQIEKCIKSAQELDKSSEYIDALASSTNAEGAAIGQAQQFLTLEKDLVNRYSEASVNAYNNKLAAMRAHQQA
jgi:hypothetical protein